ncbi:restriction endonuclease subunit S [Haemophilus influenzae]|nr:restriction endonuclease subunit S [Haemophilus influenzae]MCK9106937.1 restriction endonuclease subunit S [Haemophilus influenzae]
MKNNRTFLEKLLDGAEVEWKPLMDLAEIGTGNSNRQDEEENGKYPFYVRSKNILRSNSFQFDETAIIIPGEGGIGDIFHYVEGKYALHQRAYRIHITSDKVNTKFLYYIMHNSFKKYILSKSVGATAISIRKPMLEKFEIPIPPLSVQTEIVKILDALTALTSELTSELILRQKQYEYYREKLLSEEELGKVGFEWKTIDEISKKISSGGTPTTSNNGYYDNGTIPWLRTQEVDFKEIWDTNIKITEDALNNSSAKWIPANCVIVAMYGATVGKTAINKIPLTTNQACANIEINDKLACYRYIFHYLTSKYEYIKSLGSGSQTNINAQIIKKLKVPVPPIEEQQRIVSILDKFETLTNSITEGLPLAIEQSQKRYEYYRELLLNFS